MYPLEYHMRTSIFAFFFGLGMTGAVGMSIGLPATVALQVVALLAIFTLALAGIVGLVAGELGQKS